MLKAATIKCDMLFLFSRPRNASTGVENAVDGFMGSLCHFSLPQWHGTANMMGLTGGGGQGGTTTALTWNHVGEQIKLNGAQQTWFYFVLLILVRP